MGLPHWTVSAVLVVLECLLPQQTNRVVLIGQRANLLKLFPRKERRRQIGNGERDILLVLMLSCCLLRENYVAKQKDLSKFDKFYFLPPRHEQSSSSMLKKPAPSASWPGKTTKGKDCKNCLKNRQGIFCHHHNK